MMMENKTLRAFKAQVRSLRGRVWLASIIATLAIAFLSGSMLVNIRAVAEKNEELHEQVFSVSVALRDLHLEVDRLHEAITGLAQSPSTLGVRRFRRSTEGFMASISPKLNAIDRNLVGDRTDLNALRVRLADWPAVRLLLLTAFDRGDAVTGYTLAKTEGASFLSDVTDHLGVMIQTAERRAADTKIESKRNIDSFVWQHLLIMLMILAVTLGGASFIDRVIVRPTRQIGNAMKEIAGGTLDAPVPHGSRRDEIGEIARATKVFLNHAIAIQNSAFSLVTELPTRTQFCEHIEIMRLDPNYADRNAAVLYVNLDRFSEINDVYGRQSGDEALRHVARLLRKLMRVGDFIAHDGADNFIILLLGVDAYTEAGAIARDVIAEIAEPFTMSGKRIELRSRAGIAAYEADVDPEIMLRYAESALSECRSTGDTRFALYTQELDTRLRYRRETAQGLKFALEHGEIVPFYQPQVDARTGEVTGMEALVRWSHPEQGVLSPWQFLNIADEVGLLPEIAKVMVTGALAQLATWRRHGLNVPRISLNCSGSDLKRADFVDMLALQTEVAGLEPKHVCIELLETAMIEDRDDPVSKALSRLGTLGFPIELDDFGTGHAAVSSLTMLELSAVKIDRSFITSMHVQSDKKKIVQAMLLMAQSMGVSTIAEGVESEEERIILAAYGCSVVQGFGIAEPMSGYDATVWLEAYRPITLNDADLTIASAV